MGWQDISLQSDQDLALHMASLGYRLRRTEQQTRTIRWHDERKTRCATPSWHCGVVRRMSKNSHATVHQEHKPTATSDEVLCNAVFGC